MPSARAVCDEPVEILERAERRLDRRVPAVLVADRPRAADVVRLRRERVVLALPKRAPDRMNRRQIHDVEAELGDARQTASRRRRTCRGRPPPSAETSRTRRRSARARDRPYRQLAAIAREIGRARCSRASARESRRRARAATRFSTVVLRRSSSTFAVITSDARVALERVLRAAVFARAARLRAARGSRPTPASTFFLSSERHVLNRSVHASTVNVQRPMRSAVNAPYHRSVSKSKFIGVARPVVVARTLVEHARGELRRGLRLMMSAPTDTMSPDDRA